MRSTSKEAYQEMVAQASPKSSVGKDSVLAFLCGGGICAFGQLLSNYYQKLGMSPAESKGMVSFSLIVGAAILTYAGVYDKLARHVGAGLVVPITGFSNAVVSSGLEFKSEGMIFGVGAKLFAISGPVIVYGMATSVLYGVLLYLQKLFF